MVCVDINESILKNLENELNTMLLDEHESVKNRIYFYKLDLSKLNEIKSVCALIRKEVGKVDILINNAGIMNGSKVLLDLNDEEITKIFNVNTLAHVWMTREFLPEMLRENKGHIVNVSSICGLVGGYKLTDYCSTKFAVNGFTESLRVELGVLNPKNQVKVSLVCPFHVKTALFQGCDINHFQWLNLSMEPDFVADEITNGVLLNKDMIFIPKVPNHIFAFIKKYKYSFISSF